MVTLLRTGVVTLSEICTLVAYGFLPLKLAVIRTVYGLPELILAGIGGSKIYKTPEDQENSKDK